MLYQPGTCSKDKPTVERDVQTIREEFLKLQELTPGLTLTEANRYILNWLINDYGKRKHGTTQEFPYEIFTSIEQPCLLPLPVEPFEVAVWKQVKVHPDCFIQVNKKAYSVPYRYVGETLAVKVKSQTVEIYYQEALIKMHLIPKNYRQTDYEDFPENVQKAVDTKLPYYLQIQAGQISGENLRTLIRQLLIPHAFINLRRAQGIIAIAGKFDRIYVEQAALLALEQMPGIHPKIFEQIIIGVINRQEDEQYDAITICEQTQSFIRSAQYFSTQTTETNQEPLPCPTTHN